MEEERIDLSDMADEILDRLRKFRLENKLKKHNKRNERYVKLYDKHEQIKKDTVSKIDSGEITQESQLKGVNRQLQRLRNRMGRIENRDIKQDEKVKKIMDKRTYNYDGLDKA